METIKDRLRSEIDTLDSVQQELALRIIRKIKQQAKRKGIDDYMTKVQQNEFFNRIENLKSGKTNLVSEKEYKNFIHAKLGF